jgi:RNA polymerase sigma factor (sigma-70 family)
MNMASSTRVQPDPPGGLPPGGAASTPDPDEDIRRLVEVGDRNDALRLLMERHGDAVYRYCREALADASLADDVQQQIFIEAHRDLPRFAGRSRVRTWLFGIARHRILDAAKARRRRAGHLADNDQVVALPDPHPGADERLDDARLRAALAGCLEQLGEHVRAAVLLRYQQGFSFEDMAEVCQEKAGTLQARVARALPTLKLCIEGRTGGRA